MFECVRLCGGISGFLLGSEGRYSSKDQLVLPGDYTAHTHMQNGQHAFIHQSSAIDFTPNALSPAWSQNQLFSRLHVFVSEYIRGSIVNTWIMSVRVIVFLTCICASTVAQMCVQPEYTAL